MPCRRVHSFSRSAEASVMPEYSARISGNVGTRMPFSRYARANSALRDRRIIRSTSLSARIIGADIAILPSYYIIALVGNVLPILPVHGDSRAVKHREIANRVAAEVDFLQLRQRR